MNTNRNSHTNKLSTRKMHWLCLDGRSRLRAAMMKNPLNFERCHSHPDSASGEWVLVYPQGMVTEDLGNSCSQKKPQSRLDRGQEVTVYKQLLAVLCWHSGGRLGRPDRINVKKGTRRATKTFTKQNNNWMHVYILEFCHGWTKIFFHALSQILYRRAVVALNMSESNKPSNDLLDAPFSVNKPGYKP